jgi:hypothetical protein
MHPGFGLSTSAPGLHPRRLPSRLTSRSSRPRVVASAMCFTLRLHMSAAPPQGGLTPALGGRKAFGGLAFQCSLPWLRLALLFGRFHAALLLRSSRSGALKYRMRCVCRLRKQCLVGPSVPRLTRSLRLHSAESSRVRVGAFPLRLSASTSGFRFYRHPPPPNNSFKPTPHRGVNSVLCATLHAVATPPRGGLTQALGGRKAFGVFAFQCSLPWLRLALLFGRFHATLLLRSSSCGALTHCVRYVSRLRKH